MPRLVRDDDDFVEYFRANHARLIRMAYLVTGDAHVAQDVVASVLGRAMLSWHRIAQGNPDAYLARAILNERTSRWRRLGRREVLTSELPDSPSVDATAAIDGRQQVIAALRKLPHRRRAAIVLRYLEDLPDEQVAEILDCSPATVRSHVFRGLAQLRTLLGDEHTLPYPERTAPS